MFRAEWRRWASLVAIVALGASNLWVTTRNPEKLGRIVVKSEGTVRSTIPTAIQSMGEERMVKQRGRGRLQRQKRNLVPRMVPIEILRETVSLPFGLNISQVEGRPSILDGHQISSTVIVRVANPECPGSGEIIGRMNYTVVNDTSLVDVKSRRDKSWISVRKPGMEGQLDPAEIGDMKEDQSDSFDEEYKRRIMQCERTKGLAMVNVTYIEVDEDYRQRRVATRMLDWLKARYPMAEFEIFFNPVVNQDSRIPPEHQKGVVAAWKLAYAFSRRYNLMMLMNVTMMDGKTVKFVRLSGGREITPTRIQEPPRRIRLMHPADYINEMFSGLRL
ncbi:hypothetical protein AAMO2058_000860700 [Amorphochlora amoebiformis]